MLSLESTMMPPVGKSGPLTHFSSVFDRASGLSIRCSAASHSSAALCGGAAIPLKPNLLRNIVRAAVHNAERVPVTIKFRMGINLDHLTFLTAGKVAEDEGCAAVGLHARTAAQLYHGHAAWDSMAELKRAVKIPVLGKAPPRSWRV